MKIVLWGTYDTGKPRIRILRAGLRAHGVEVLEIHQDVWKGIDDKSSLRNAGKWLKRGLRLMVAYPKLVWRYLRVSGHDLVLVSYPGQLDVLIIRPFAWMRRKPVVFDWFISAYDTVVEDRKLLGRRNPLAWLLWAGEWLASHAADLAIMDTIAHARRMEALFRLPSRSLGRVWVGAEDAFFQPSTHQAPGDRLQVLFYGQFIPLHGIDTIIAAARLLRDEPVQWTLIGRGQEAPRIHALLAKEPLPKLRWLEWVPYEDLREQIDRADICLGIFGTSEKAASVIPNKVFQILASGKPLVTRDSPAIRELLTESLPCTCFVKAGDAKALADAIHDHLGDARTPSSPCHVGLRAKIDCFSVAAQFMAVATARFSDRSRQK